MNKKALVGWILSGVIAALLIFPSAGSKFTEWEGKAEAFGQLGWTADVMFKVGIVEVAAAVLFLIPRTALFGAILLSAYLGGAVASHVRINDAFFMPIIIGVLVWIALGLRDPRVFALAFGRPSRDLAA